MKIYSPPPCEFGFQWFQYNDVIIDVDTCIIESKLFTFISSLRVFEFHFDVDLKACLCWSLFLGWSECKGTKCCVMLDNFVCLKERVFDISC